MFQLFQSQLVVDKLLADIKRPSFELEVDLFVQ